MVKLASRYKSGWYGDTRRHYLAAKYGSAPGSKRPSYMANRDQYLRVDPIQDVLANSWQDPEVVLPKKELFSPTTDIEGVPWNAEVPPRPVFTQERVNPKEDIMFVPWSADNPVLAPIFEEEHNSKPSANEVAAKAAGYYSFKDWMKKSDDTPKDEGGIFGAQFKNDSMMLNARQEQSERKRRVWEDKIEKGTEAGLYKSNTSEEFLELFKGLQRQYVNKEITKQQFDQELESKGNYLLQGNRKSLSVWGDIGSSGDHDSAMVTHMRNQSPQSPTQAMPEAPKTESLGVFSWGNK